jgi:hypothetical protein
MLILLILIEREFGRIKRKEKKRRFSSNLSNSFVRSTYFSLNRATMAVPSCVTTVT